MPDVSIVIVTYNSARVIGACLESLRAHGGEVEIALDEPVAAISPGQSLVLYSGERLLGGGFIASAQRARTELPLLAV